MKHHTFPAWLMAMGLLAFVTGNAMAASTTINPTDATGNSAKTVTPKIRTCVGPDASTANIISWGTYVAGGGFANQPSAPVQDMSKGILVTNSWNCELNRNDTTAPTGYMQYWRPCPNWTDPTGNVTPTTMQYIYVTHDVYGNNASCRAVCYAMTPQCDWY